jgi:hypothetical protein
MAMDTDQVVGNDNTRQAKRERLRQQATQLRGRVSDGALVLRDTVKRNPKATAGIAAGLLGLGVLAMVRSASRIRRRKRTVAGLLAAAGLWRTLYPLFRKARKQAPRLSRMGKSRLRGFASLLQANAGPLLRRGIPYAVDRFARR